MAFHLNFDVISLHINLCKCVSIFYLFQFMSSIARDMVNSKHMKDMQQRHQWHNNNFQDTTSNKYIGSTCVFTGRKRTVLFSWLASLSARRGENIHNAGLSVRVVWDAPNRVDEQTNQESAPFNSHPRHFLLTIRRYCFVVKSRLLVSWTRYSIRPIIFFSNIFEN